MRAELARALWLLLQRDRRRRRCSARALSVPDIVARLEREFGKGGLGDMGGGRGGGIAADALQLVARRGPR